MVTPCYGGVVDVEYFNQSHRFKSARPDRVVDFMVMAGESSVNRARSNMASAFLDTEYDVMAFLDADIELDAEDFWTLVDSEMPIRGAAVGMKTPDRTEALSCWLGGRQVKRSEMSKTPFRVDFLGAAVMFVARDVLKAVSGHSAVESYDIPGYGMDRKLMFTDSVVNRTLLSEDYTFCHLARSLGYDIWCYPGIKVTHYGRAGWKF